MKFAKPVGLMAAGALALASGMAQAGEGPGFYAGVGYSQMTLDAAKDFVLPSTTLHVGLDLSPKLQIEARYAINTGDDNQHYTRSNGIDYSNVNETYEATAYWAVLAKVHFPIAKAFSVYAIAGLNHLAVEGSGSYEAGSYYGNSSNRYGSFLSKGEETGATYGVGAQLNLGDSISLAGEYQVMTEDVSGFNVGLSYRF